MRELFDYGYGKALMNFLGLLLRMTILFKVIDFYGTDYMLFYFCFG
jgi:hypothetical protein